MPEISKPQVLIVDDDPDNQNPRRRELETYGIDVNVVHPDDVTSEDLANADLVLVDLILEHWPVRDSIGSIAFQPNDGLALTAVLRSHNGASEAASPTAFAIHTAHLTGASQDLPPEQREHAFARLHNLEWAFAKSNFPDAPSLAQQIVSLAKAVKRLPATWPRDSADEMQRLVYELLGLSDTVAWSARAWEDIQTCHPPIHELYAASHGLAFLRWLLHRILPYPCFLWDTHYLAARLRVTYESLSNALIESRDLTRQLETFKYTGLLADFLGQRWWRSGAESFLWDIAEGNPFDPDLLQSALTERTGVKLQRVKPPQPVVCIDSEYRVLPIFVGNDEAIRIQPDDWPPYADQAWTTIELANRDPSLRQLVISQDRDRLDK